jgi:hypothetical protein
MEVQAGLLDRVRFFVTGKVRMPGCGWNDVWPSYPEIKVLLKL